MAAGLVDLRASMLFKVRLSSCRKGLGLSHSWLKSRLLPFPPANLGDCQRPTPAARPDAEPLALERPA